MPEQRVLPPTLLFVIGPPAVGKMSVGAAVAEQTGFKLFHNHMTIEPLLRLFPYDSPHFARLNNEFRTRILQEAAASDLPGLVFSVVWYFDDPADAEAVDRYATPFRERGSRVLFLELTAPLETRLERNVGATRLAEKPSKQNLEWSRQHVIAVDGQHQMNSHGWFDGRDDHLLIDNSDLTPDEVARQAVEFFHLDRRGVGDTPDAAAESVEAGA
jgi:hypothetical protein